MSNRVTIEPTKFVNVRTGSTTFGYRAYDDYGGTYSNILPSLPDDDLDFLKLVAETGLDEALSDMIDYCANRQSGLYVGNTWHNWDDIKSIFGYE